MRIIVGRSLTHPLPCLQYPSPLAGLEVFLLKHASVMQSKAAMWTRSTQFLANMHTAHTTPQRRGIAWKRTSTVYVRLLEYFDFLHVLISKHYSKTCPHNAIHLFRMITLYIHDCSSTIGKTIISGVAKAGPGRGKAPCSSRLHVRARG